jgi:hypothetical protein
VLPQCVDFYRLVMRSDISPLMEVAELVDDYGQSDLFNGSEFH